MLLVITVTDILCLSKDNPIFPVDAELLPPLKATLSNSPFIFFTKKPELGHHGVFICADVAITPNPKLPITFIIGIKNPDHTWALYPTSLKIFLTALAVIDDLGAIIVIAIFYTKTLIFLNLFIALGIFGFLILLNRLKVHNLIPYIIGGIAMWYFMHNSGVHATLTGVLLAFAIPFRKVGEKSPSYILQHVLHKPVAFFILPLFAMANTGIPIGDSWQSGLMQNSSIGIMAGLIIGKPLGILLFSFLGVSLGLCSLQPGIRWMSIIGVGFLAGIGFTMSIFITLLAFTEPDVINNSKIAIILGSIIAGTIGYVWLKTLLKSEVEEDDQ